MIQKTNTEMIRRRAYRGQNEDLSRANHRYEILVGDFRSLYRSHHLHSYGIDVNVRPEYNIDEWLNPQSPNYKSSIAEVVFYYAARTDTNDRLKVCISTPEMRNAAWTYCHKKQIVIDGTFGLCTSRLLLWIALGVDESGAGVPVAMFLFSAPTGTRATHAGYDTTILTELLSSWKAWLGTCNNEPFQPFVAITDTDAKERGALILIWEDIILILCRFHVRQCWTNRRKQVLSKGEANIWKTITKSQLSSLEEWSVISYSSALVDLLTHIQFYSLLNTTRFDEAIALVAQYEAELKKTQTLVDSYAQSAAKGGLEFLQYLRSTWMTPSMWTSWSRRGRELASHRLGIPIEGIIPTTNHLEALNGSLKKKYIPQWQHSGRRLRFDLLIYHLTISILPQIYARRRMITTYTAWKAERFREAAHGQAIMTQHDSYISSLASEGIVHDAPRAWFSVDERRDILAGQILDRNQLQPLEAARLYEKWAKCESSSKPGTFYWLTFHPSGAATCTCPDFLVRRAGACKHLRAFRIVIEDWVQKGKVTETYHFAANLPEAIDIELKNRRWYEAVYSYALTPPAVSEDLRSLVSPHRLPANFVKYTGLEVKDAPPGALLIPPPLHSLEQELEIQHGLESESDESSDVADIGANDQPAGPITCDISTSSPFTDMDDCHNDTSSSVNSITTPRTSNVELLTTQLQTNLNHDITSVLPRLHGILVTLRQPDPRIHFVKSAEVRELEDIIGCLDDKLSQIGDSLHHYGNIQCLASV